VDPCLLVSVLKKHRPSTIPTLRNVIWKAGNHRTRQSCHGEINMKDGTGDGYHAPLSSLVRLLGRRLVRTIRREASSLSMVRSRWEPGA
jgi:hypothetical protein